MAGAQPRLPDWLNPWWSETREIHSPMDAEAARTAIANASGFLKGSLGKVLICSLAHSLSGVVVASPQTMGCRPGHDSIGRPRLSRGASSRQNVVPVGIHHVLRHLRARRPAGVRRRGRGGGPFRRNAMVDVPGLGSSGCRHLRCVHDAEQRGSPWRHRLVGESNRRTRGRFVRQLVRQPPGLTVCAPPPGHHFNSKSC